MREEHTHCTVANLWPDFFSVDRDGSAHVDRVGISRGRWSDRVWFGIRDEEDARSRYHGRERAKKGKGTKHRKLLLYVAVEVLIKPSLSLIATSVLLGEDSGGWRPEAAEADRVERWRPEVRLNLDARSCSRLHSRHPRFSIVFL